MKTDESKLKEQQEQLDIPVVMASVLQDLRQRAEIYFNGRYTSIIGSAEYENWSGQYDAMIEAIHIVEKHLP